MSDLADRLQAALNILSPGYPEEAAAVREAIELLRWRDTAIEQPEAEQLVQFRLREGRVYAGWQMRAGHWHTFNQSYSGGEVVAWRPLGEK